MAIDALVHPKEEDEVLIASHASRQFFHWCKGFPHIEAKWIWTIYHAAIQTPWALGYYTNFTSSLLDEENAIDTIDIKSVFKLLEQTDSKHVIMTEVVKKPSLHTLNHPIHWTKLWDIARNHGIQGSRSLLAVFTALSTPIFTDFQCPHCVMKSPNCQPDRHPINILKDEDEAIFSVGSEPEHAWLATSVSLSLSLWVSSFYMSFLY